MKKTNAARFLDKLKIEYEIREYEVDESDLGAENVASKVGLPLERVFKTLVARGDKTGVIMAVVSGAAEVDLKALASASGNKKVEMVHLNEVLPLTGYIRGGVSPPGGEEELSCFSGPDGYGPADDRRQRRDARNAASVNTHGTGTCYSRNSRSYWPVFRC